MLGLRGCRLGLAHPDLPVLQARAIAGATAQLVREGLDPHPLITVPLVAFDAEFARTRSAIEAAIAEVEDETGVKLPRIPVGTMIELPRAAVTAEQLAAHADFFSFGTNDLTQTALGLSRDDAEGTIVPLYLREKILGSDPFETLDDGVARLIETAADRGREANPTIELGLCGEQGGDLASILKVYNLRLDYVSCSPYRVPVARLAAAQATLRAGRA